jgi:hypothetical protein
MSQRYYRFFTLPAVFNSEYMLYDQTASHTHNNMMEFTAEYTVVSVFSDNRFSAVFKYGRNKLKCQHTDYQLVCYTAN